MKIIIKNLFILAIFSNCISAMAEVNLDRLIKNQQDIDKSTRLENNLEKKDVYASDTKNATTPTALPVEENCLPIDEIVLNQDFLNNAGLKKLKQNAAGRCLGVLAIQQLAIDIQDYIIKSGYVTSRIEIPDQDLSTKKLIFNVVPGKIEKVIIKDNAVRKWVLPFKSEDILNIRDIEQGLELVQRIPLDDIKIYIAPGSQNEYSNVVIDVINPARWNTRLWINNWGDKSTGKTLANGAGYLYNLAGVNDIFYLSGTTQLEQTKYGGYQNISAYYSFPFGYWEYEIFYSQSQSKQNIAVSDLNFKYQGDNRYFDLKGSRTIYRDQSKKVKLITELFRRKAHYQFGDQELQLQKRNMTNIRFGLNYKQQFYDSVLDTTISYQRFVQWLGAKKTPDMIDGGGVSPESHILNLDLSYIKNLGLQAFDSYYQLQLGAQYSPKALTIQDQFSIGNRWSVRGFENSAGRNGYSGFYNQNTWNIITGIKNLEWYIGLDYGQVWDKNSDEKQSKLMGTATGFRGSLYAFNYDMSLSAPLLHPDNMAVDRVLFNFNIAYQL
ncbi:ShlB/FhaC/HecB family hemolysin secretion/activation protein [Utexia brackfieldae]|uniref:ShlB/FhaC/HecB family hemolysin secretion/activation protein n=1 Tax=Utexia brackfieldae TaxID=3074108 RepID=UPI00370DC88D